MVVKTIKDRCGRFMGSLEAQGSAMVLKDKFGRYVGKFKDGKAFDKNGRLSSEPEIYAELSMVP